MVIKASIILFVFLILSLFDQFTFSTAVSIRTYSPSTKVFDIHAKKVSLAPDGYTRDVWTINGTLPGPILRVTKGDRVKLRVHNGLDENTAIHNHGLFQRGTNWYDGFPGQSQCPIPAHSSWEYDFSVPDQIGTYWYHSHFGAQYVDGMLAALIIDDPEDPYLNKYDEEIIIVLQDYYHTEASKLSHILLSPEGEEEPVPDNGLINGLGRFNCSLAPEGSKCTDNSPLAKFTFEYGKVYRLRIINAGAFAGFFFSIDQHELEVIEVEGTYVKPAKIHRLPIHIAQRYSVLVRANQKPSSYWMRSEFMTECLPEAHENLTDTVKAIVTYKGCSETPEPKTTGWKDNLTQCIDLKPSLMKPLYPEEIPNSDKTFRFEVEFHSDSKGVDRAFVNNSTYVPTTYEPTLQKIFDGTMNLSDNQNAYFINKKQVVDIHLINTDDGEHPFHLHGHKFWVLADGNGTKIETSKFNTVDPVLRDTSTVPALGWLAVRFIADNPGIWAFHCHIEWHLQQGLLAQFVELPDEIKKLTPPPDWRGLCLIK